MKLSRELSEGDKMLVEFGKTVARDLQAQRISITSHTLAGIGITSEEDAAEIAKYILFSE